MLDLFRSWRDSYRREITARNALAETYEQLNAGIRDGLGLPPAGTPALPALPEPEKEEKAKGRGR